MYSNYTKNHKLKLLDKQKKSLCFFKSFLVNRADQTASLWAVWLGDHQ